MYKRVLKKKRKEESHLYALKIIKCIDVVQIIESLLYFGIVISLQK